MCNLSRQCFIKITNIPRSFFLYKIFSSCNIICFCRYTHTFYFTLGPLLADWSWTANNRQVMTDLRINIKVLSVFVHVCVLHEWFLWFFNIFLGVLSACRSVFPTKIIIHQQSRATLHTTTVLLKKHEIPLLNRILCGIHVKNFSLYRLC